MYPQKLLKELTDNSDRQITEFLSNYRNHFPFCQIPPVQLYETVIDELLHCEDEKSAIRKIGNQERKKRRKNKQRWYAKLAEAMNDNNLPASKHPFGSTILIYRNSSRSEWELQFGKRSLDDVLKDKFADAAKWRDDPSLPLVSYPAILSIGNARAFKALKSDIAIDICHTLEEKYNGTINSFWHIWPNEIIDLPLFSPKQLKMDFAPAPTGELINRLFFGNGAVLTTSLPADAKLIHPEFSFTELDMRIICELFSHIDNTFIINQEITCSLRSLVNALTPSAGTYYYETVIARLKKYPCYTYRLEDPKNPTYHSITFNIFDNVSIQPDSMGHVSISVKPASYLAEQIINNQITCISKKEAECLSLPLSKILMFKIQRERVLMSLLKDKDTQKKAYAYPYSFFERAARLHYSTKSQNLLAITEALQEMADHGIFVRSFRRSGNRFFIIFYPLSKEEQADFNTSSLRPAHHYLSP
jgi:hypothetical protein